MPYVVLLLAYFHFLSDVRFPIRTDDAGIFFIRHITVKLVSCIGILDNDCFQCNIRWNISIPVYPEDFIVT